MNQNHQIVAQNFSGVSMRTMSTQMGTTGSDGRPEGLSEVQESLLEHATPEAGQKEELAGNMGAVKPKSRINFVYEVDTEMLQDPEKMNAILVNMPFGKSLKSAKFIRANNWV